MANAVRDAELRIPGDLMYLRPVRSFVRELAENSGFCHEKVVDIELAVDEIFSNAVEHGSAGSGSRIIVCLLATDEMIEIVVRDTGQGKGSGKKWLDAWTDAVRDRSQPNAERGHGLLLAHNLADEMSMESNSVGGLDIRLVIHKGGQKIVKG